jgi:hypothetical protein
MLNTGGVAFRSMSVGTGMHRRIQAVNRRRAKNFANECADSAQVHDCVALARAAQLEWQATSVSSGLRLQNSFRAC